MEKISVIVPVYNAEQCLHKCVESILNQTYDNIEIILIDDGSTDASPMIIDEFAARENVVIAIHQKNKGVSAARNAGIKKASGKYICFVDADDYIDNCFCEFHVGKLEETGADMSCCNWDYVYEGNEKKYHEVHGISEVMDIKQFIAQMFESPITVGGSIWNKLFINEKIICMFDENVSVCEDNLFLLNYCLNIRNACYIDKNMYHVYDYKESSMRKNPQKIVLGLDVRREIIYLLKKYDKRLKDLAESSYLDFCLLYYNKFKEDNCLEIINYVREHMGNYLKSNFTEVCLNKNIYWKTKLVYFCVFLGIKSI